MHLPPDENLSPAPIKQDLDEWFYIDRKSEEDNENSLTGKNMTIVLDILE